MSDRHHPKAATCFFHVVKSFATLSFSDDVIPGEIFSLAEKKRVAAFGWVKDIRA